MKTRLLAPFNTTFQFILVSFNFITQDIRIMKEKLFKIEQILDEQVLKLKIYQRSFQSIYSNLLFAAEIIDYKKDADNAMDYLSRTSLIYPILKKHALDNKIQSTTESIISLNYEDIEDINFLNAYAHLCMLMPQVHRGTLVVKSVDQNLVLLDFANDFVKESELVDKLYSAISLPISFEYNDFNSVKKYTDSKAIKRIFDFGDNDLFLINNLFEYHYNTHVNVEVLPKDIIESKLGFSNKEYVKFIASWKAFSDYVITLGRSYYDQVNNENTDEDNSKLWSEYMEWTVCCLNHKILESITTISQLSKEKFDLILAYFIEIYSDNTQENFKSNSFVGEGFMPPVTLIDKSILFSPLSMRYLLSFNNILYSINKNNRQLFDNEISQELEPVLINQVEYLFSFFTDLECRKNINYADSEIDLFVLSEKEGLCLSIQVKTTIAPDSSRSVDRVQGRTVEALEQIKKFEKLGIDEQTKLINNTFQTKLKGLKIINLILVRSSAGSDRSWKINQKYKILNYIILAKLLSEKIDSKSLSFAEFDKEIYEIQERIKSDSDWGVKYEKLKISDYEIEFPNIYYDQMKVIAPILKTFTCFKKLEKADH